MDCLARLAGEVGVEELLRKASLSRKQPLSRAVNMLARNKGKQHIINIYGTHLSDGTVRHRKMASMKYEEAPVR
jgi:hypothetical protein